MFFLEGINLYLTKLFPLREKYTQYTYIKYKNKIFTDMKTLYYKDYKFVYSYLKGAVPSPVLPSQDSFAPQNIMIFQVMGGYVGCSR